MTTQIPPGLLQTPYRKNRIINAGMNFWQRGTTGAVADFDQETFADRFNFYNDRSTGAATYKQSTDVPTVADCGRKLNYSLEIDITTALATPTSSNEAPITYSMEGYDYATIQGKNATLSFWVKSNKTGTYALAFRNTAVAAQRRSYMIEYTIDVADTWEKKIFTISMTGENGATDWDYTNGTGVSLTWAVMSTVGYASTTSTDQWIDGNTPYSDNQVNLFDNTANYFRLAGVQFEPGNVATELEVAPYGVDLASCQRYYFVSGATANIIWTGDVTNGLNYYSTSYMPVIMRVDPTFTFTEGAAASFASPLVIDTARSTDYNFTIYGTSNATASRGYFQYNFTADAEL